MQVSGSYNSRNARKRQHLELLSADAGNFEGFVYFVQLINGKTNRVYHIENFRGPFEEMSLAYSHLNEASNETDVDLPAISERIPFRAFFEEARKQPEVPVSELKRMVKEDSMMPRSAMKSFESVWRDYSKMVVYQFIGEEKQ